ncbi:helix-turn-helix transcriptional regulator [Lentzea sp. NPDC102401]|uniref:helix-turn-helix transcriptional regulator n=1 Tax=Lentzea sp. NPDC102401 TaxID=3364128 RepID=UPI00382C6CB4
MRKARMSRQSLGRMTNLSQQTVVRRETGVSTPSARNLRAAAQALHVRRADLLYPPDGEPSLADLRMNYALTTAELAVRSATNLGRLQFWELTGRLGTADESAPLLSAFLGLATDTVDRYLLTGQVPGTITRRLAQALHVAPLEVQAAFDRTATLYEARHHEIRTAA